MAREYYVVPPGEQCCQTPGGSVVMRGAAYSPFAGVDEGGESCSCQASAAGNIAPGIEAAVKSHPFLALIGAFLLGCALNSGSKKGLF